MYFAVTFVICLWTTQGFSPDTFYTLKRLHQGFLHSDSSCPVLVANLIHILVLTQLDFGDYHWRSGCHSPWGQEWGSWVRMCGDWRFCPVAAVMKW